MSQPAEVYVDQIRDYPSEHILPSARKFGTKWCHMASTDVEALHTFAEKLGLSRAYFQKHPRLDHYDLTPTMREKAIAMGAISLTGVEMLKRVKIGVNLPEETPSEKQVSDQQMSELFKRSLEDQSDIAIPEAAGEFNPSGDPTTEPSYARDTGPAHSQDVFDIDADRHVPDGGYVNLSDNSRDPSSLPSYGRDPLPAPASPRKKRNVEPVQPPDSSENSDGR